ncbi:hypothetical protein EAF00_012066 [Botryotinia globosa]|nr:hypothetical protein EAF00_012066 [Botryotinia globosa]
MPLGFELLDSVPIDSPPMSQVLPGFELFGFVPPVDFVLAEPILPHAVPFDSVLVELVPLKLESMPLGFELLDFVPADSVPVDSVPVESPLMNQTPLKFVPVDLMPLDVEAVDFELPVCLSIQMTTNVEQMDARKMNTLSVFDGFPIRWEAESWIQRFEVNVCLDVIFRSGEDSDEIPDKSLFHSLDVAIHSLKAGLSSYLSNLNLSDCWRVARAMPRKDMIISEMTGRWNFENGRGNDKESTYNNHMPR